MRKLTSWILVLALLLAIMVVPVLASDISGARYRATIVISNNSSATTNVATVANISTSNLIAGNYLNTSANNCVMRTSSGADVTFMPGYTDDNLWCMWVESMGANSLRSYILYTANSTGGLIRYFPAAGGMTTPDDDTDLELSDNFTIEQKGWVDTTYSDNKTLVWKPGAFITYISGTGNITSGIAGAPEIVAFDTGDDTASEIYGANNWEAQTFTTPDRTPNFPLGAVELLIYREGSPETVTASIRATTATGNITGADLASGTINGSTLTANATGAWTVINLGYFLEPDTTYGVILKAVDGDVTNSIWWRMDTANGYAGGSRWSSNDEGITWIVGSGQDFMFRIQGYEGVTATGVSSDNMTVKTTEQPVLTFDGVDDYVHCGADSSLNAGSDFTLIQWINFNADNATEITLAKFDAGAQATTSYRMYRDNATNYMNWGVFRSGGTVDVSATSTTAFTKDEWRMVAVTFNGTYDAGIYVNGVLEHSANLGGAIQNTTANFTIGCQLSGGTWNIGANATIGENWAYSRALSEAEILQHYNGSFTDTTDLVGYWKLNEGSGTTAIDHSPETNTGVIVSATWGDELLRLYIDDELEDIADGASVPDTSENWSFAENGSMLYLEDQEITIHDVQVQYVEWEYAAVFDDQSAYDNDATPSFRAASSDLDVSANMTSFLPVAEAEAPDYVLGVAPPFIDADALTGNLTGGTFTTVPPTGGFPLAGVIVAIADATGTPPQLPLLIIAVFCILAASLTMSATIRRYGSGSLIVKIITITAVMGVFIGLGNFGIDFWMLVVFLILAVALGMGSKQIGWQ